MISVKLTVLSVVLLALGQAFPDNKWGGERRSGFGFGGGENGQDGFQGSQNGFQGGQNGFQGGQNGFQGGSNGFQGGPDGLSVPSGFGGPGGPGGFNGGQSNGMGGGFPQLCQAPISFPPQFTNATIDQIKALWIGYVAGTNCTSIQQQQTALAKAAFSQSLVAKAANMTAPAQAIFNLFKSAYDAYNAATAETRTELRNFEMQVITQEGGLSQQGFGGK